MNKRHYDTKTDTIKSVAINNERYPLLLIERLDYIIKASKIAADEINELAEIEGLESWRERAETLKKNIKKIEEWTNDLNMRYFDDRNEKYVQVAGRGVRNICNSDTTGG
jgi:hypothetical protein